MREENVNRSVDTTIYPSIHNQYQASNMGYHITTGTSVVVIASTS